MRISLITPSLNQGKYIKRAIESVLAQRALDIEFIVVDGGSTDETLSILKRYESKLRWISEPDSGPAEALNKGFRQSTGSVLCWLNADDIYYPGALDKVITYLENNPSCEVLYGKATHIDVNDQVLRLYPTKEWNFAEFQDECFICQPAAFFRRSVFELYGPFNENVRCMDYEFWLRLGLKSVHFQYYPKLLAATRLHGAAFTVAHRLDVHREINDFTRKLLGRTPETWIHGWACALAEDMGIQPGSYGFYVLGCAIFPLFASLRWNGSISKAMVSEIIRKIYLLVWNKK